MLSNIVMDINVIINKKTTKASIPSLVMLLNIVMDNSTAWLTQENNEQNQYFRC